MVTNELKGLGPSEYQIAWPVKVIIKAVGLAD